MRRGGKEVGKAKGREEREGRTKQVSTLSTKTTTSTFPNATPAEPCAEWPADLYVFALSSACR